jgi:P4 family phage/plasmid primase-like protien
MSTEEIRAAAEAYHELGISIIPFKISQKDNGEYEKTNLSPWKKWMEEPQTDEEFRKLDWNKANAFAVILGTQAKNGFYLAVVDYDTKGDKASVEAKAKGKELLREFPITQTHETVNRGVHLVYWSRARTRTDGTFHDNTSLELLGEKKLCLLPPSQGYSLVNDNSPTEIESLEDTFYGILKRHGFSHTEETEVEQQLDAYSFSLSKIVDLSQMKRTSVNEYQGSHPIHDSTTEKNFCVNVKTNTWHCFRHNSGGGALQYLAMKEGLIKCEQAKKGALRGKKFRDALTIAASQGLIDQKVLEQKEINPVVLAKDIMEDYVFAVDQESNELFFYDGKEGIYSNSTEQLLKREIAKRLDENFKTRYYTEINEFVTATAPLVRMDSEQPEILAIQNGLLNIITLELSKPTPKVYLTSKLQIKYDPTVKCPEHDKFLSEVMQNETHRTQAQEFVGHCLYRKIITDVSAICLGIGANGKSVWLHVITQLLGPENVSSHSIQRLCYDHFVIAEIKGKYANIHADLPNKELLNTGTYKQLTSGDRTSGYRKHIQKTFEFEPFAKYLFSANETPPVASSEDCYAWYRRFVIWDFKRVFQRKEQIPRQKLIAKLTTPEELSGMLNWALKGLARLMENGDLSGRETVEEVRKEYIKRSNSALAYFEEKVKITDEPEDYVFTDAWFRDYVTYCHQNKLRSKKLGEFLKTVKDYLPGAEKTKIRVGGRDTAPLSAWRYVKCVPCVPAVPGFAENSAESEKNQLENFFGFERSISESRNTWNTWNTEHSKQRVCGQCDLWHKGGCCFPGDPSCVAPTNPFAQDCRSFTVKGERLNELP